MPALYKLLRLHIYNIRINAGKPSSCICKRFCRICAGIGSPDFCSVYFYTVIKESHLTAERMSEEELSDSIYSALFSSITDVNSQIAYMVRMDDATVSPAFTSYNTRFSDDFVTAS